MELVRYEAAKRALAEAVDVDEVKQVRDKSTAVAAYARQAGDKELELDARELRLRAERRLGKLMVEMPKNEGEAGQFKSDTGGVNNTPPALRLEDVGIDKNLAKTARVAASLDDEEFEEVLDTHRERGEVVTISKLKNRPHVTKNSGENEWYTPSEFIEAARATMGAIDLDPCSSAIAQQTVQAKHYYTIDDDGLSCKWDGRVWMNPPYGKKLIGQFCSTLVESVENGRIEQACVLVNNATETGWFQQLLERAASICLIRGRIRFLDVAGDVANTPLQGQSLLYFGTERDVFADQFGRFGTCLFADAAETTLGSPPNDQRLSNLRRVFDHLEPHEIEVLRGWLY